MYAAAVHEGKLHVEASVSPDVLKTAAQRGIEQLWLDLESPTAEELGALTELFRLHPLAVEECDHTGVRPKIEQFDRHLFVVLHGINHNEGEDELKTVEFKFFLWKHHLITVHDRPSTSVRATQERIQRDPDLLVRQGVDSVMHHIVDAIIDHYFPILERIEARVEEIESQVFRDPSNDLLEEMLHLQRRLLTLNRIIHPQLDILGALASGRYAVIGDEDAIYFRDVYDHVSRISERANLSREMLAGAMQCYLSQVSNRMNSVMKALAVLATIVLPASFVTSLLGMNLEHLPGRRAPETFWVVSGLLAAVSAVVLVILRRLRWL